MRLDGQFVKEMVGTKLVHKAKFSYDMKLKVFKDVKFKVKNLYKTKQK